MHSQKNNLKVNLSEEKRKETNKYMYLQWVTTGHGLLKKPRMDQKEIRVKRNNENSRNQEINKPGKQQYGKQRSKRNQYDLTSVSVRQCYEPLMTSKRY